VTDHGKTRLPYSRRMLRAAGAPRTFRGEHLAQIAFPLGGIGTGTVSLGGRGELRDWEIFNHPSKGQQLPYTFFAVRVAEADRGRRQSAVCRVLERELLPPFSANHGLSPHLVAGLPRLREASFSGTYPFARIEFDAHPLPVGISLEAWNPFIPLNDLDSGLPLAVLDYRFSNPTSRALDLSVIGSITNPVSFGEPGRNRNRIVRDGDLTILSMSGNKHPPDHPLFGTAALAVLSPQPTYLAAWPQESWWNAPRLVWNHFRREGRLADVAEAEQSPEGQSLTGSVGSTFRLEARAKATAAFLLAWHFPNRINTWDKEEGCLRANLGNWYARRFSDAVAVIRYAAANLPRLQEQTRRFERAFFNSTLPAYVLEAASSQVSTIRTNTCFRMADGSFHGFEGCAEQVGCCPMNCTHVWNYEQALAYLFPALERSLRRTDFLVNTDEKGHMAFRTRLPLAASRWEWKPAADGQMGSVIRLYREWQLSGDLEFLRELWPAAKRALEYAWKGSKWDADCDGVMEGEQHNTYDIEFYGANTMVGTLYLGALRAAQEMARALGDKEAAALYRRLFRKGKARYDSMCFNGEYYVQRLQNPPAQVGTRFQYGEGCLADQLLGQWLASMLGLGYLLPREHVASALKAIFRYNWRPDLSTHHNLQRTYALNQEAGLLLGTWPRGGEPPIPFPYSDEVWTGSEYQVASHLIYEEMVEEGLAIVQAIRNRHDGRRRNPWNESECGDHYARAMSSWALILALSGFVYSAPQGHLEFAPRLNPRRFRGFWSTGSGWGSFTQRVSRGQQQCSLEVAYGTLMLRSLGLRPEVPAQRPVASIAREPLPCTLEREEEKIRLVFSRPVQLCAEQTLQITL